jgi:hypothetical protein
VDLFIASTSPTVLPGRWCCSSLREFLALSCLHAATPRETLLAPAPAPAHCRRRPRANLTPLLSAQNRSASQDMHHVGTQLGSIETVEYADAAVTPPCNLHTTSISFLYACSAFMGRLQFLTVYCLPCQYPQDTSQNRSASRQTDQYHVVRVRPSTACCARLRSACGRRYRGSPLQLAFSTNESCCARL